LARTEVTNAGRAIAYRPADQDLAGTVRGDEIDRAAALAMKGDPSLSIDRNGFRNGTRTDLTYAACPPNKRYRKDARWKRGR
jgi:hypothetical protein